MSDSRELAQPGQGGGAVAQHQGTAVAIPIEQRMAMMREALTNPNVDPAKAREMFSLMRDVENDARQAEFNHDKIAAIQAMPAIYKRGKSDKHRYAKFEDLHRAVMPVLAAHNLTLDFRVGSDQKGGITVQPILRHRNGFVEEGGTMQAPPDQGPGRSPVQAIGSTTSYLKRHSMKAMLNIIEDAEDDDGVGGSQRQLNDRQQNLIIAAQEAAERGEYGGYFQRLPANDKALLIRSGIHASLGGQQALPGAQAGNSEQSQDRGHEQEAGQQPKKPAKMSAADWVKGYVEGVEACKTLGELRDYQTDDVRAKAVAMLKNQHPTLHADVIEANAKRFQELGGKKPEADNGGLFEGSK